MADLLSPDRVTGDVLRECSQSRDPEMRAVDWVDNLSKGGCRETLACVCLLFRHLLALLNFLSKVTVCSLAVPPPLSKATSLTYSDRVLQIFAHYPNEGAKLYPPWRSLCPTTFPQLPIPSHRSFSRAHPTFIHLACPATDGTDETTSLSFLREVASLADPLATGSGW